MSITTAMFTGVSGLLANAEGINVIGNNLANVNTVGFKGSNMMFADALSSSIGNNSQIGRGSQVQCVDNVFGQGSFETTTSVTDIALQGNSFFALGKPGGNANVAQNNAFLTRAGSFGVDSTLTLTNPDGYQVLDTQGNPIKFSDNVAGITAANTAVAAANTPLAAAINTQAGTIVTAANTFQGTAAVAPAVATAAEIAAQLAIKTAAATAQTAATAANTTKNATDVAAAQTAFDALTTLANNSAFADPTIVAAFATFKTALAAANTANTTASTTAAPQIATAQAQLATANGLAFSKITSIDPSGLVTYLGKDGTTTNYYNTSGQVGVAANAANAATVQRLAVMTAANTSGLEKVGGTLFKSTAESGIPSTAFSLANNSANGNSEKIYTNSLEQSNVDMAAQFVKMILTQRAYSANSKTITTADEMTQEVLNLKR